MGPAGSGKSTLAKRLQETRPATFARVPVDFFFVPRDDETSIADYLSQPFAYDWESLDRAVGARGPLRSTPVCDFEDFRRRAPTGGLPIAAAPILVLDGMRPHPRCDFLVVLELDQGTQDQRLRDRDQRWGTQVADRRPHLDATYAAGLAEMPHSADLVLSANDSIDHNAKTITDHLRSAVDVTGAE